MLAERIRQRVGAGPFDIGGRRSTARPASVWPQRRMEVPDAEDLIAEADRALTMPRLWAATGSSAPCAARHLSGSGD